MKRMKEPFRRNVVGHSAWEPDSGVYAPEGVEIVEVDRAAVVEEGDRAEVDVEGDGADVVVELKGDGAEIVVELEGERAEVVVEGNRAGVVVETEWMRRQPCDSSHC